jgi:hypothetical protein
VGVQWSAIGSIAQLPMESGQSNEKCMTKGATANEKCMAPAAPAAPVGNLANKQEA